MQNISETPLEIRHFSALGEIPQGIRNQLEALIGVDVSELWGKPHSRFWVALENVEVGGKKARLVKLVRGILRALFCGETEGKNLVILELLQSFPLGSREIMREMHAEFEKAAAGAEVETFASLTERDFLLSKPLGYRVDHEIGGRGSPLIKMLKDIPLPEKSVAEVSEKVAEVSEKKKKKKNKKKK